MRSAFLSAIIAFSFFAPIAFAQTPDDITSLNTKAVIAYKNDAIAYTSVVPRIEPDQKQTGIYWLRLAFYPYQPGQNDIADIVRGKTTSMDARMGMLPDAQRLKMPTIMNLALGPDLSLRQFSIRVANHQCAMTGIVPTQVFKMTGSHVVMKIHGDYYCDLPADGHYYMDVDIDARVFKIQ